MTRLASLLAVPALALAMLATGPLLPAENAKLPADTLARFQPAD